MINEDWNEKYKPKIIEEVVGNVDEIGLIKKWFQNFEEEKQKNQPNKHKKIKITVDEDTDNEDFGKTTIAKGKTTNKKSCLFITGSHGVGKSCLVQCIIKALNYECQNVDFSKINIEKNNDNKKEKKKHKKTIANSIFAAIERSIYTQNIQDIITKKQKHNKVIIIDEIESFVSPTEKLLLQGIVKYNSTYWVMPIILISNGQHNKITNLIKQHSTEIKIRQPSSSELFTVLINVCYKENMEFSSEDNAYEIINHSDGDYRQMLNMLQDIKKLYRTGLITSKNVKEYLSYTEKKTIDLDIYKATNKLLFEFTNIKDCLSVYETEKTLVPLVFHQNYINLILNAFSTKKFTLLKEISNSLSRGDTLENHIFSDQTWDLKDIHGYYSCVKPSYLINKNREMYSRIRSIRMTFPLDLNRTSIKRINNRNIKNASKYLPNINTSDFVYINAIMKTLVSTGKLKDFKLLLEGYDIPYESIDATFKTDKLKRPIRGKPNKKDLL